MNIEWDWEVFWRYVLSITVAVVISVGTYAVTATHRVDGYYLSQGSVNRYGAATCVYAHWTWHADELVMCGDSAKALDFAAAAQALLTK